MNDITAFIAFTAGLLSFLSPCVFPLVPAYVANLTDSTFEDNKIIVSRNVLILRSLMFILGFSLVFVALGASASALGQVLSHYRDYIIKISGLLVIIFGMQMAGIINIRFLNYEKKVEIKNTEKTAFRSLLLGLAFGIGWTPCISLALSSILLLAGSASTVGTGIIMLLFYSLGFAIPFFIITLLVTFSLKFVKSINKSLGLLSKINGWILIILGLLLFTNQIEKISAWLTQLFQ